MSGLFLLIYFSTKKGCRQEVNKMNPLKISIAVVLLFSFGLFFIGTDGFQAFTAETARTNDLIETQPEFPEVTLEDSHERTYSFSEFEGKHVFITFMYTACTSVCPQLEMNMYNVYKQLPEEAVGEDIVFLSISFDPENDDPETLSTYAVILKATEKRGAWQEFPIKKNSTAYSKNSASLSYQMITVTIRITQLFI